MRVGIPCMKCSLHPSQQVNSKTGKRSKTCGVSSAWNEMNDERIGRDQTIDKDMTHLNVWMDGHSDMDVEDIVEKEIERINLKRKEAGKRSLRQDAVSVVAIVEKPNMEYMQYLSYQERVEFLKQSHAVMRELINEWNPNWNVLASVQHHDEFGGLSAHNHTLVMLSSIDKDGLPNMQAKSEFNLKFFNFINKNYSLHMQKHGYDVENVRTYDQLSEEEKLERKLNPQEHGVDAYVYKKKKLDEMDQTITELTQQQKSLSNQLEETVKEITKAPNLESYKSIVYENQNLKSELAFKDKLIEKLRSEISALTQKAELWKNRFIDLSNKAGIRLMKIFGFDVEGSVKNDLPTPDTLEKINGLQNGLKEYDPERFRVISDKNNPDKFCIVYLNKNHQYEIFEDNLSSRRVAESKIRELKSHFQIKSTEITNEIK